VNLGNDADTTGAIYGQLAGAFYGVNAIPEDWIERLTMREFIRERADALFDFSTALKV
jgi:ADP-ribosyl-[dinitrogen reductase] hydrolase